MSTATTTTTIADAGRKFYDHLRGVGKKESTLYRYNMDIELIVGFFGADNDIAKVMPARVGLFLKSPALLVMKSGKDKSKPTIDRTVRVMKQLFEYCVSEGILDKSPMPKPKVQPVPESEAA